MSDTPRTPPATPAGPGPRDVVLAFFQLTVNDRNYEDAKKHLNRRTLASDTFAQAAVPPGSTYVVGAEEPDPLGTRVPTVVISPGPDGTPREMNIPILVVQEDGSWKIDLATTMDRLMGGVTQALDTAMSAVGEALGDAMTGIGEAIAEGLGGTPAPAPSGPPAKAAAPKPPALKPAANKPVKPAKKPAPAKKKPAPKAAKKPVKKPAKKTAKIGKKAQKKSVKKKRK